MKFYNSYIVTRRFKGRAICGDINLPYGTECSVEDGMIICPLGVICAVRSQNALDFFTQNDDGNAIKRREIINTIFNSLERNKQSEESYNRKWDKVWNDALCQKYKRPEHEFHWLWNYDFYNASIEDLQYIAKLVG